MGLSPTQKALNLYPKNMKNSGIQIPFYMIKVIPPSCIAYLALQNFTHDLRT